ncbi:hypothetical protein CEN45_19460 [Fischerella thermalis CCMEE 5198]|nr:hypothetical protein CI594_08900 [Fischerella thermalis CCMEE 5196]PMB19207.1 hypothetical protein CEN45_19460 [Fischerella thermalis CCMEE 5198]PMB51878.1 hypothetical protein CEN39_12885 [Fischerella thermalis CCMEE 5201]
MGRWGDGETIKITIKSIKNKLDCGKFLINCGKLIKLLWKTLLSTITLWKIFLVFPQIFHNFHIL